MNHVVVQSHSPKPWISIFHTVFHNFKFKTLFVIFYTANFQAKENIRDNKSKYKKSIPVYF